ncbi:MAG: carbohydrate ABC transporter permease [Spirochaetaceae bacterium]|jgi:raffinose/stachyose/melibiose transport system permease protein|nr:carbohydrate ABC transporter permease [Spirochaetaceae bacterium]
MNEANRAYQTRRKAGKILLCIFLAVMALSQIFPLVWIFTYSIKKSGDLFGPDLLSLPRDPQWINYYKAFTNGRIPLYLANTLKIVIPSVVLGTILPFCLAYACTRMEWKLKKMVWGIVILGMTIPIHTTLLPNFIWYKVFHLIDTHLGLIISYMAFTMSFNSIVFSGLLLSIPKSMEESAFIDGAGYHVILPRIIAPMAVNGFITVGIMTFLSHWNDFLMANTYLSTETKRTLPFSVIRFAGQYASDYAVQFAVMTLVALPPLIFYFGFNKWMLAGVTAGSVKG